MHLSTLWNDDRNLALPLEPSGKWYHPHNCFFFFKEDLPLKLLSAVFVPKWTCDIYPMNTVRITQNQFICSDGKPSFKFFLSGTSSLHLCLHLPLSHLSVMVQVQPAIAFILPINHRSKQIFFFFFFPSRHHVNDSQDVVSRF